MPPGYPPSSGSGLGGRWRWLAPVLKSRYFWLGLVALAGSFVAFLFLFNFALMPLWTRHGAVVEVPEVRELSADEAERALRRAGLRAERREQPFNPNLTPDVVVDQNPLPNARVKPGRPVYFYVNASPRELVRVPDVRSRSELNARRALEEAGLVLGDVALDTLHTPNDLKNTVTRQTPQAGHAVPRGTRVTLWLSPGLGNRRVVVPDVAGLTMTQAQYTLRRAGLWPDPPGARSDTVRWTEPAAGTRLREGSAVRLRLTPPPPPPPPDTTRVVTPPPRDTTRRPTPPPVEVPTPQESPTEEPAPPQEDPKPPPSDEDAPKPPAEEGGGDGG